MIEALGNLISVLLYISILLMSRITHLVRPICLEDWFDNPVGPLHVSGTMLVESLGSYGQSQI